MKNENRAVFDRASERYPLALDLPPMAHHRAPVADEIPAGEPSFLGRLIGAITGNLRRRRNRLALLELNDDQLKDIGVSRSQAYGDVNLYRRSNALGLERKCL